MGFDEEWAVVEEQDRLRSVSVGNKGNSKACLCVSSVLRDEEAPLLGEGEGSAPMRAL